MKRKRWSWTGCSILFVTLAILTFSGSISPLRAQPVSGADPNTQPESSSTTSPTLSAPSERTSPPQPAEPPKIERPMQPRIPSSRPGMRTIPPRPPQPATPPAAPNQASDAATAPPSAATPPPAAAPPPDQTPPPAATPPPAPQAPPPSGPPKSSGFVFNFDNADLYEVIRVMAGIMKINYIIDPKVKGTVNIHTAGQLTAGDVFPIFQSILKLNGATAIKKENIVEIVPLVDAKKLYTAPSAIREPGSKALPEEKYTIQIIQLKYIPVAEVSKIVKPFLSDGADIIEHPPNNIIIIGDVASNVKKCLDIIDLFDIDFFTDLRVRLYPIANADVTEVAKEMERIFASFEVSTKSGRGIGITFTPVTRINTLLVVSAIPNVFEKVEGWLKELDKIPTEATKSSVFVYYCQNAKAKDLADVLKGVFMGAKDKKDEFKTKVTEPTPRGVRPTPAPAPAPTPPTPATPAKEESVAVPEGEINIVVDEANNALVIRAFARDYKTILETVKKLDIYPRQVLIEVLLADITLDDSNQFGIEWSRFLTSKHANAQSIVIGSQPVADPLTSALQGTVSGGLRYAIVDMGERISAAIRAAAIEGRLKVIISPNILASNNKEAKIQIGESQPILTTTFTTGATVTGDTTTNNVIEGTIEYKDIGTILTVTPRISDGGLVTLEIGVEDSTLKLVSLGSLTNVPAFNKTTAKTTLSIMEGQAIAIGGIIRDSKNMNRSGVPFLNKLPLIGFLFGNKSYVSNRRELILLLTPHVIGDQAQSKTVTDEFKGKIKGLKEEMEKREKK